MSEKDTNCDDTNVKTEGMGDCNFPYIELPDCCRPMMERMMKACSEPREGDGESAAENPRACCGEPK